MAELKLEFRYFSVSPGSLTGGSRNIFCLKITIIFFLNHRHLNILIFQRDWLGFMLLWALPLFLVTLAYLESEIWPIAAFWLVVFDSKSFISQFGLSFTPTLTVKPLFFALLSCFHSPALLSFVSFQFRCWLVSLFSPWTRTAQGHVENDRTAAPVWRGSVGLVVALTLL